MKNEYFVRILHEFFEQDHGAAVVLSGDQVFLRTLRSAVHRVAGSKRHCLFAVGGRRAAARQVERLVAGKVPVLVFVERMVNEAPSTDFIMVLRKRYPNMRIIVLAQEIERDVIAYFMELGVANVICKPVSMNNVIEKMAFSLQPPGQLGRLLDEGRARLEAGDFEQAMGLVEKILSLKPGSPAGLMLQGDIHLAQDRREDALDAYMAAHHSSEMYIEPIKRLAHAFQGLDDEKALEYLKKLDFISPLNPDRKADIGKAYLQRRDLENAEEYFDQSLRVLGREAGSLVSIMAEQIAEAASKVAPGMAEKYLRTVIESRGDDLDHSDLHTFNRLGMALRSQGKWREAVENYRQALEISPDDEALHYNMALAFQDGRESGSALDSLRRALDIYPNLPRMGDMVALNMGNITMDAGHTEQARDYYRMALEMNPGNRRAKKELEKALRALRG